MLVVGYAVRTRLECAEIVPSLTCPLCQRQGGVEMSVFRPEMSVGRIPYAPLRKFGAAYCHDCQRPIPVEADRAGLKAAFRLVAKKVKVRLRSFAFLIGVFLILAWVAGWAGTSTYEANLYVDQDDSNILAASPHPGDVFAVLLGAVPDSASGTDTFQLFKVLSVSGENVTLLADPHDVPGANLYLISQAGSLAAAPDAFQGGTVTGRIEELDSGNSGLSDGSIFTLYGSDGTAIGEIQYVVRLSRP